MDNDLLNRMVELVHLSVRRYGFDALADRDTLRGYLLRRYPGGSAQVDACLRVLFLPRYMDGLRWISGDRSADTLRDRLQAYYVRQIQDLTLTEEEAAHVQYLHMRLYAVFSAPSAEASSPSFTDLPSPKADWDAD